MSEQQSPGAEEEAPSFREEPEAEVAQEQGEAAVDSQPVESGEEAHDGGAPRSAVPTVGRLDEDLPATRVRLRSSSGDVLSEVDLDETFFGIEPNVAVMHQVVTAQLASARAGTHNTKTRAEVSGGGRKPYRQKGTGRARQGSIRAPHWVGGGVALGPKPRSYRQRTPKKMIALALRSALSDRATERRVALVDTWDFPERKTKEAVASLSALGLAGTVLVVLSPSEHEVARSFSNLASVHVLDRAELNAYDVLRRDWVVFTRSSLPGGDAPETSAGSRDGAVGEQEKVVP